MKHSNTRIVRQVDWFRSLMLFMGMIALLTACGGGAPTSGGGLNTGSNGSSANEIKIGVLATFTGAFAVDGQDALRGVKMAVAEFGGKIGNKKIVLVTESSDATPAVARDAARKLIEQDNVDILVGPLSGDEGLAVRDYAKTKPNKVFLNGSSGAQDTTLRNPAPNFYRFSTDGTQWMAGLGDYVYQTQGYKRVAVLAEDYSFPYSQVGGFMTEFCRDGGHVVKKFWVPIGTTDYSSVVSSMPTNIDAIYVALGGSDSINFLKQYVQFGGKAKIIGGTVTVDQTVLSTKGTLYQHVLGVASSGPIADNNPDPAWQKFVQQYKSMFPDGFPSPSLFAHAYYVNAKAALLGLQKVNGDLSNGEAKLKQVLSTLQFDTPTGPVRLDHNRNAIANIFVTVVDKKPDGTLYNKLVKVVTNVNQTLGIPEDQYLKMGPFSRDNPSCP
ncbi:MAG TPA: ABC transporter substrate-binding protein [Ktedonobacteraceae bacterium]|jgi:branched-chain amino acid transport system substrate-binding protein|nr:ABC transporter substrate-binding protein [Ktedonobacteraceae bacterium]